MDEKLIKRKKKSKIKKGFRKKFYKRKTLL